MAIGPDKHSDNDTNQFLAKCWPVKKQIFLAQQWTKLEHFNGNISNFPKKIPQLQDINLLSIFGVTFLILSKLNNSLSCLGSSLTYQCSRAKCAPCKCSWHTLSLRSQRGGPKDQNHGRLSLYSIMKEAKNIITYPKTCPDKSWTVLTGPGYSWPVLIISDQSWPVLINSDHSIPVLTSPD